MTEKFEKLLEFFKEQEVTVPTDVKNSIEDVFNENDNVEDVDIYFKEDSDLFEDDLILVNDVSLYLSSPSKGSINNVFTYYGEIDFSLTEFTKLYDGETLLEDITKVDQLDRPSKVNSEMFAVVLVENVKWELGKLARKPHLYIYCPFNSKDAQSEKEDVE
jgi:hypothetical protein